LSNASASGGTKMLVTMMFTFDDRFARRDRCGSNSALASSSNSSMRSMTSKVYATCENAVSKMCQSLENVIARRKMLLLKTSGTWKTSEGFCASIWKISSLSTCVGVCGPVRGLLQRTYATFTSLNLTARIRSRLKTVIHGSLSPERPPIQRRVRLVVADQCEMASSTPLFSQLSCCFNLEG